MSAIARSHPLPSGLTRGEVRAFQEDGFFIKPGLFVATDLEPLRRGLAGEIAEEARELHAQGAIRDTFAQEPFETRLARLMEAEGEAATSVRMRIHDGRFHGPAMLRTMRHERLLACVQDLVGPEIVGSSAYRVRPKLPNQPDGVPWHQDSGYFLPHCDRHLIVTCWIALVDATVENGCLHVIPRAHTRGVYTHCSGGGRFLFIPDAELPGGERVPCEMKAGSVLFFTNLTPHASFINRTDCIRWAVDLRFQGFEVPNNVGQSPDVATANRDPVTMACYPPEADFVIRDTHHPDNEVTTTAEFAAIRERFWRNHPREPERGWKPGSPGSGRASGLV